ncbi:hypothetical protein C5167_025854 [Papaver somniferum]|uniref:Uncharacterized protein n=1 Tax=Papaver somniferum TaxID=3469 RepID=A0A4Y7JWG6_PAPSO|nr:hypothetical protein C5167_025854 [Papaver somniferum]
MCHPNLHRIKRGNPKESLLSLEAASHIFPSSTNILKMSSVQEQELPEPDHFKDVMSADDEDDDVEML